MNTTTILALIALALPVAAFGQAFGSAAYCSQLAEIGANAYQTKKDGHPMNQVLQKIGYVLQDNTQKKDAAQGVIIAVYGDSSIKSSSQAYNIGYSACKR